MNEKELKIFNKYRNVMFRNIKLLLPELSNEEIARAINYSINKRIYNAPCIIDNNYKEQKANTNLIALYKYIQDNEPILTSYGCLFHRHGTVPNPTYQMIQAFGDRRSSFKKKMLEYPKGSDEYNRYNLMQQVAKVDVNAIYGSMGASTSIFYNVYVATSITRQGRSSITSSIMLFESFLANNIKFGSLDDVITFIDNVVTEKNERKFVDKYIIDHDISVESVFAKLVMSCGYRWLPSDEDLEIIWRLINRLDQEDLNRIYYKNNLFSFFDNAVPLGIIQNILQKLKSPFIDPNHPPEIIIDDLNSLVDVVKEYVYYHYQIIDKIERAETLIRQVDITTDTDSCIITLNPWYVFISNKMKNVDIDLKHYETNAISMLEKDNMNEASDATREATTEFIYDFMEDDIIERKRKVNPFYIIPEDAMRHSIINILAYILGKLLRDYFDRISITNNVTNEAHPECLMSMKNEFLFMKMLLTDAKKHYATIVELQEGHVIPNDPSKRLDIKGLEMDKSVIPESTRKTLTKILYENVLSCDTIDQKKIINQLAILERKIFNTIVNGSTEYFKPAKVKNIKAYANPIRIQQVKASIIYDLIATKNETAINLNEQNPVLVIKTRITKSKLEESKLKDTYPSKYNLLMDAIDNNPEYPIKIGDELYSFKLFSDGINPNNRCITSIAIPYNIPTPKWILEFIDYDSIITENIGSFPLESVGITRLGTNSAYSGIINL